MNTPKKLLHIWSLLALLLSLGSQAIQPAQAASSANANPRAPQAYSLAAAPTAIHPGGAVRVYGSGYTPNATYLLRYEMPQNSEAQEQPWATLALTQTVTANSQGQIYDTFTFDPALDSTCPWGCYLAIYPYPYVPPELAVAPVALLDRIVLSISPKQGAPGDTIDFTVTNLEAGQLVIDLGGQIVYGPAEVAAGTHSDSFTVPLYPRGSPGDGLTLTFLNLVNRLPAAMRSGTFTLLAASPEPEYQFINLAITPDHIAPGMPFTVTGQVAAVGEGGGLLDRRTIQALEVEAMWQDPLSGVNFSLQDSTITVDDLGNFTVRGFGASLLNGDPLSIQDGLNVKLSGKINAAGFSDQIFAPAPITETLNIQAIDIDTGLPIPDLHATINLLFITDGITEILTIEHGRNFPEDALHNWSDAFERAFISDELGDYDYAQETDAGGHARVVFDGEKLVNNPIDVLTFDAIYGQAFETPLFGGAALTPADTASIWTPPVDEIWQYYEVTVLGRDLRYFYCPPGCAADSEETFTKRLWFNPANGEIRDDQGEVFDPHEPDNDPMIVPMHYVPAPDPQSWGPSMMLITNYGRYLGEVHQGWPLYDGVIDFTALDETGYVFPATWPSLCVSYFWNWDWGYLANAQLEIDGETKDDFSVGTPGPNCPTYADLPSNVVQYTAAIAYPTSWASLGAGAPHELTLRGTYNGYEMERHVYLDLVSLPASLINAPGFYLTFDHVSGSFTFSGQDVDPAQDSYGAEEASSSEAQTPQTGPLTNNLIPSARLMLTVRPAGDTTNQYDAAVQAPEALSFFGADSNLTGLGTSISYHKEIDPLIYMVLPLYAAALSDPLGGWIVTITSGSYVSAWAKLTIDALVDVDVDGQVSTNFTLDARAVSEGVMYLSIDVLMGFLATGSMTLNPAIGLDLPLRLINGTPNVDGVCFSFWMGMSYYIGAGCACVPFTDICDCLFDDSDSFELFSGSMPSGCWATAISQSMPWMRPSGAPSLNDPACPTAAAPAMIEHYHPVLAADGLGKVTAAWKGDLNTLYIANFAGDDWAVTAYDVLTLGAESPALAFYQPDTGIMTWNAYDGEEEILPTLPITEAMRTTYVAWGIYQADTLDEMGVLAEDPNGAGGAVLGSCMEGSAGCPAGGQVTAAWLVDRVPGLADMRTRLFYRSFENDAWGAPAAIPLDSNDSDSLPQVIYVEGQPLIVFIRDEDGLFETTDDRRLAFFDPANPIEVEIPADLPDSIVQFSAAAAPDGSLRLAFNRIDAPEVGLIDNRHPLYTAEQSCDGACTWAYQKMLDSYGRAFYVEAPSLTINSRGEATIAYRAMGMSGLPGQYGNEFDFTPKPGDSAGLLNRTGEQASLSFRDFSQRTFTPSYLTQDGAVNWEVISLYDPFTNKTFQMSVRYAGGAVKTPHPGLINSPGVTAQSITAGSSLTFAALTDEPDFAVYAEGPAVPYLDDSQPAVITVTVQNVGMSWDGEGQPLHIAATWDDPDGLGIPAGEALLDELAAGATVSFTLNITAPLNAVITHTLYVQALPSGLVTERATTNNTATLTLGGLPAPTDLAGAAQNGVAYTILRWTASTDSRVTGYRIYRSTDGGDFESVGSTFDTQWLDIHTPLEHTYTYYLTAFTAEGVESTPSTLTIVSLTEEALPSTVYLPLIARP